MRKFDMIIGYGAVKKELKQIADTLKNREYYEKLGVSAPRGLLLHGEPGVGKSLMAAAIIEASGRKAFVCRKDQPNGDFVKNIKETFDKAMEETPSIVLLDDMDKFANGDERHPDAEEYVTVQSCIDNAKSKDVFVIATVNNIYNLPRSLRRAGRFDRIIEVMEPQGNDALEIIRHYLQNKNVASDVDPKLIAHIMDGRSCAELETVVNAAGMYAGFERAEAITMEHLLDACLRIVFEVPTKAEDGDDNICCAKLLDANCESSQIVYHEAGHAVQYAKGYGPIKLRAAIIPACNIGSQLGIPLALIGAVMGVLGLVYAGLALFGLAVLFQVITLPVEFNASRRAINAINSTALLTKEESSGAKAVLSAAAMTYVAAMIQSLLMLLYYVSRFTGRRD